MNLAVMKNILFTLALLVSFSSFGQSEDLWEKVKGTVWQINNNGNTSLVCMIGYPIGISTDGATKSEIILMAGASIFRDGMDINGNKVRLSCTLVSEGEKIIIKWNNLVMSGNLDENQNNIEGIAMNTDSGSTWGWSAKKVVKTE